MLPDSIVSLIREEQARQANRFIDAPSLDDYLAKLGARAEVLADTAADGCRACVAFYCNDLASLQAYITLVLVDPRHRGQGLGRALVACVLDLAKRRGFTSCRLEVAKDNAAAHAMYRTLGFAVVEDRPARHVMEIRL